jgi:predicted glycoside hydrolase/deacetylase ChbG (UPF0249 family)
LKTRRSRTDALSRFRLAVNLGSLQNGCETLNENCVTIPDTQRSSRASGASNTLLILNCDDLGMAHSINRAAFEALDEGTITSASVMVPCPWFPEVASRARESRDWDLGIHFTLTSEWQRCRWGPVAPANQVKSLVDPHGYLWSDIPSLLSHARPDEVAKELDAQVERALHCGIRPTHVDCHMFAIFQHPDDVLLDDFRMASEHWPTADWEQHYRISLGTLGPGITECAVHLGYDDEELRAITGRSTNWGSAWRQRDLEVLRCAGFREFLAKKKICVMGWKDIAKHECFSAEG